jgi:hypothetical protein
VSENSVCATKSNYTALPKNQKISKKSKNFLKIQNIPKNPYFSKKKLNP